MIKANPTIFKFYLLMMDSFSDYISQKYTIKSIGNPDHYKTIIIKKIVGIFHTLNKLTKRTQDEVSCRCVLRSILDNITTYCFIYERDDVDEIMFRHYLYEIDGYNCYKNNVVNGIMEKGNNEYPFEQLCDEAIKQLNEQLVCHPFSKLENEVVNTIINNVNWKFESLQNPQSVKFQDMYIYIGFNKQLADYYQGYLSQFVHGLSFSNLPCVTPQQIGNIVYESIPMADRLIQAMYKTFPKDEKKFYVFCSRIIKKLRKESEFNTDNLFSFAKALIKKDKTIII